MKPLNDNDWADLRPAAWPRPNTLSSRRSFAKAIFWGTAVSMCAGRGWSTRLLADCEPVAAGAGILRVRIQDFPALATENGSVRLALNAFTQSGPASGGFYPVLINRGAGAEFFALSSRCTHQGCVVPSFRTTQSASVCPCHGSRYAIDGTVIGGPATSSLAQYPSSFDGSVLCVEIPRLGYSVVVAPVSAEPGARLRLGFATVRSLRYQVEFRPDPSAAAIVVPFATSETGPATTLAINGTGTEATVYVDPVDPSGVYVVSVIVAEA